MRKKSRQLSFKVIFGFKPLVQREDDYFLTFRIKDELSVTATIRIARRKVKKRKRRVVSSRRPLAETLYEHWDYRISHIVMRVQSHRNYLRARSNCAASRLSI